MYVCICLVARKNQRVFRNSSLQMFACTANDAGRKATGGPSQELDTKWLVYLYYHNHGLYNYIQWNL